MINITIYIITIIIIILILILDLYPIIMDVQLRPLLKTSYITNNKLGQHFKKLDTIIGETNDFEGHIGHSPNKIKMIQDIIKKYNVKNVCEIGFNAGHSAAIFLDSNVDSVTSFDLCTHKYSKTCLSYLQKEYPNKLKVICGDSLVTVPKYKGKKFDLILVDGDHYGQGPYKDLDNTLQYLAKEGSIILMDDTNYSYIISFFGQFLGFTVDKAWENAIESKKIKEIHSIRGMSAGKKVS